MAVSQTQRELDALAVAGLALASAGTLAEALQSVADGAAAAVHADVAIAHADVHGRATALGVAAPSHALAAKLLRTTLNIGELHENEASEALPLPPSVQR